MKTSLLLSLAAAVCFTVACGERYRPVQNAVPDFLTAPALEDVRLEGAVGRKMDCFFAHRIFSSFARDTVMQEAEDAFRNRVDDVVRAPIGYWQG